MPISIVVLWIYIVLLLAGGIMGFVKAGSKVSLITSSIFAILLALVAIGIIKSLLVAEILIGVLGLFFIMRYAKSKKFMPAGLMVILSVAAVAAVLLLR